MKSVFALLLAVSAVGSAQEAKSTVDDQTPQAPMPEDTTATGSKFPVEVAGYLNFRYLNDDALQKHLFHKDYSGSLFLSKTVGRWRFHAEFNAGNDPEYDFDGIHLFPRRPSLSVKLDSGFVNYNSRDWLQFQGGLLFIPTYWRTHRYQSTTLTVDDPLIDQNIFPTSLKGGMVHGDKYFGEGGVSYMVYGGVDQSDFQQSVQSSLTEQARGVGGKLTFHLPSGQFFNMFDISFHRLHRVSSDRKTDEIYGGELLLRKGRWEVLAEFAHGSFDEVNGVRSYISQGYYVQPSYRVTRNVFAVVRYDQLNRDSRYLSENSLVRQSAGLTYRPIPSLSLKLEGDRFEPHGGLRVYYGVTSSIVWFFHVP